MVALNQWHTGSGWKILLRLLGKQLWGLLRILATLTHRSSRSTAAGLCREQCLGESALECEYHNVRYDTKIA